MESLTVLNAKVNVMLVHQLQIYVCHVMELIELLGVH